MIAKKGTMEQNVRNFCVVSRELCKKVINVKSKTGYAPVTITDVRSTLSLTA